MEEFCRSDDDVLLHMKCVNCGYEEGVPQWLIAEEQDVMVSLGEDPKGVGMVCPKCHGHMKLIE
jgi:formate dehydrogenase maturation protein FdhE